MRPAITALRQPALVLLAVALMLLAPSLLLGMLISHSSPQNLIWSAQFAEQFRAGILYPRWMPQSFDGLGSPAFYFYPPLPFWLDGLVDTVTFGALSTSYRLALSSLLLMWASGLAMHAWLARETGTRTAPLVGAIVYMAAPYHLLDLYVRGAFAECAGYAVLPLLMLAIRRLADRPRMAPVWLAIAYATLLLTHLPTALLTSVAVIPPYVLFRAWRTGDRRLAALFLLRAAAGGALGMGLAALYLVPALSLQDAISSDQLWTPFFQAENWLLLAPQRWPEPVLMQMILSFALAAATLCIGLCLILLGMKIEDPTRFELGIWVAICLLCLVLMSGALPWLWQVPLLAKVQFPWRILTAVEFAAITALGLAPLRGLRSRVSYLFIAAAVALGPGVAMMLNDTWVRVAIAQSGGTRPPRDTKEYLPAGYPQVGAPDQLGLEPLKDVPLAACTPAASICRAEPGDFGALRIEVENTAPTTVVLRRFVFPAWRLDGPMAIVPTDKYRLVSFVVPAGHITLRLQRVTLPAEQWGLAISGVSLVLLLAAFNAGRRTR